MGFTAGFYLVGIISRDQDNLRGVSVVPPRALFKYASRTSLPFATPPKSDKIGKMRKRTATGTKPSEPTFICMSMRGRAK